jgi:hypothetical protein
LTPIIRTSNSPVGPETYSVSPSTISVLRQASVSSVALAGGAIEGPVSTEGPPVAVAPSELAEVQPASDAKVISPTSAALRTSWRRTLVAPVRSSTGIADTFPLVEFESQAIRSTAHPPHRFRARELCDTGVRTLIAPTPSSVISITEEKPCMRTTSRHRSAVQFPTD